MGDLVVGKQSGTPGVNSFGLKQLAWNAEDGILYAKKLDGDIERVVKIGTEMDPSTSDLHLRAHAIDSAADHPAVAEANMGKLIYTDPVTGLITFLSPGTLLNGYATQAWVQQQGYLTSQFWSRDAVNGYLYPATIGDKVGIGTNAVRDSLEVKGTIRFGNYFTDREVGIRAYGSDTLMGTGKNYYIKPLSNDQNLIVSGFGYFGTTECYATHLGNTQCYSLFVLNPNSSNDGTIIISSSGSTKLYSKAGIPFQISSYWGTQFLDNNNNELARIYRGGFLGVNNNNPLYRIHVKGDLGTGGIYATNSSNANSYVGLHTSSNRSAIVLGGSNTRMYYDSTINSFCMFAIGGTNDNADSWSYPRLTYSFANERLSLDNTGGLYLNGGGISVFQFQPTINHYQTMIGSDVYVLKSVGTHNDVKLVAVSGTIGTNWFSSGAVKDAICFKSGFAQRSTGASFNSIYGFMSEFPSTITGTIVNQYGLYVTSNIIAQNAFGVYLNLPAGAGNWNLYAAGTARNYLNGQLGLKTDTPTRDLDINGTLRVRTLADGSAYTKVLVADANGNVDAVDKTAVASAIEIPELKLEVIDGKLFAKWEGYNTAFLNHAPKIRIFRYSKANKFKTKLALKEYYDRPTRSRRWRLLTKFMNNPTRKKEWDCPATRNTRVEIDLNINDWVQDIYDGLDFIGVKLPRKNKGALHLWLTEIDRTNKHISHSFGLGIVLTNPAGATVRPYKVWDKITAFRMGALWYEDSGIDHIRKFIKIMK